MPSNILLIVVDTARADIFYEMMAQGELPAMQSLADDGLRFDKAISSGPWTLPAHASIFTGKRSSDHGTHAGNKIFNPDSPTFVELLNDDGYDTNGISGNIWISPEFGFDRGFNNLSMKYDRFWSGKNLSGVSERETALEKAREFINKVDLKTLLPTLGNGFYAKLLAGRRDKGAANTTRRTRKWIRKYRDSQTPFFYFINYLEPHLEYEPQKKYASAYLPNGISYNKATRIKQDAWEFIAGNVDYSAEEFEILRALYKGEIRYIDHQVGELMSELEKQDIREETTVIVVGDHGENIGDHGLMDHQYCLYQTLVHVPLLISGPSVESSTVGKAVETRDLFPTILDIANVSQTDRSDISSNSLLNSSKESIAVSEYLAPQPSITSLEHQIGGEFTTEFELDRAYRAIQDDTWKLIEASDGSVELYDLESDPVESQNLSDKRPDLVATLREEMDKRNVPLAYQEGQAIEASDASKQRLADLGYI